MMISLISVALGVCWILTSLLFQERIYTMYDNMAGLDDGKRQYFKSVAIRLPGVIFIVIGLVEVVSSVIDFDGPSEFSNDQLGTLALLFGLSTLGRPGMGQTEAPCSCPISIPPPGLGLRLEGFIEAEIG